MWHLENKIIETNLVTAVHPHRETDSIGRWNLLIHKDNLKKTFAAVQEILDNYESIVPDDPTVRAKWEHKRRVGNGKTAPADVDSNGDQSYATLSMASLSSILTTENQSLVVTTTTTSFDLTTMEVAIPQPPTTQMNYLQAVNGPQVPTSTHNELRLQALVEKLTADYELLKASIQDKSIHSHHPFSDTDNSTVTNTTSSLTASNLLDALKQQQIEYQAHQDAKQAQYQAQMEARFENMMNRNIELEEKLNHQILLQTVQDPLSNTSTNNKKQSLAPDANSQAQQSDPKGQDSKATPTKNHPVMDVLEHQNP